MNQFFSQYVHSMRIISLDHGIRWDLDPDASGLLSREQRWNLTEIVGGSPPYHYLSHLGLDAKAMEILNARALADLIPSALSKDWSEFLKAVIVEQLLVKKNSTVHTKVSVLRPLQVIATCATDVAPWMLTVDHVVTAIDVAREMQDSGKLADVIIGFIKTVYDANHLGSLGPIAPLLNIKRLDPGKSRRAKFAKSSEEKRRDLNERKKAEKLPERRAFWELLRIVCEEEPRSVNDVVRFSGIKIMLMTGFRVGEATLLTTDCKQHRDYIGKRGSKPSQIGGIDRSLALKYFAEKQQGDGAPSEVLVEALHHVPPMFERSVLDAIERAEIATKPLRSILEAQIASKRIFPQFGTDELVSIINLYPNLTGNPFILDMDESDIDRWIARCRADATGQSFDALHELQVRTIRNIRAKLNMATYQYFNRLRSNVVGTKYCSMLRTVTGTPWPESVRAKWTEMYVRIGELEDYIGTMLPTKLPDWHTYKTSTSEMDGRRMLFLSSKRPLAEQRNDGLCDVHRYFSINAPTTELFINALGTAKPEDSIFQRYSHSDEDRALFLTTHSLRHLQNTELFRLGIADSLITKRFGRRSVAQSYVYDHRSLAEELDQIELDPSVEVSLGEKSSNVFKLIQLGRAKGPIVEKFKDIQAREGDDAAIEYLKVEADGYHATPYGLCLNSFTVDPCPKHLECTAGCRHFSATNLEENRASLMMLERRLADSLRHAEAKSVDTVGRTNQINHAKVRLEGVRKILTSEEGERPFPNGEDFSVRTPQQGVLDV